MNNAEKRAVVVFPGWGDDALHGIRLALTFASIVNPDIAYYCLPFGWKVSTTGKQVQQSYKQLVDTKLSEIVSKHKETSIMGVSAGVSLALLYALQHPNHIVSVVAYCGCIQYNKDYFKSIPHEGFEYAVKKLHTEMKKNPRKTDDMAKKLWLLLQNMTKSFRSNSNILLERLKRFKWDINYICWQLFLGWYTT